MKCIRKQPVASVLCGWSSTRPGQARAGATLSEALVALLIMAIGVISLASLFPIAVLKTARANQLTNATNIRYNAEAMMKIYPWIFSDPNPADTGPNGIPNGNPFDDYDFSGGRAFLFDPMGAVAIPQRPVASVPAVGILPRFGGGFNASELTADVIASGPDTWTVLHDNTITAMNATQTQMDVANLSTVSVTYPGPNRMRAQIFFNGGKSSFTRMITGITGANTLLFTEDINNNSMLDAGEDHNGNFALDTHALPAGITYESARIEVRERRYSWLLTVRPQDIGASFTGSLGAKPTFDVTVVVFFGRDFSLQDEQVYGTLPAGVPAVPNLVGGSTALMPEGQRTFVLSWPAGSEPNLKRGGYILDAQHGYWYQIENYSEPNGATQSTITLTSNILDTSTLAVLPKGVVDIFPIAPQSP